MTSSLFIIATAILSVELFSISMVSRFLEQKSSVRVFFIATLPFVICSAILYLSLLLGSLVSGLFVDTQNWYSATILFFLSLKLFYDAKKLTQAKRSINPLDFRGLFVLITFAGMNVFFVGVSFGLKTPSLQIILFGILVLFLGTISGFIWGIFAKRLFLKKFDWIAGFIFLIMSLILVLKF